MYNAGKKKQKQKNEREVKGYQLSHTMLIPSSEQYLSVVSAFQDVPVVIQLVGHCWAVDLHTRCENHQLIPLAHLCKHTRSTEHMKDTVSPKQIWMLWHEVVRESKTMKRDGKDDKQDKGWTVGGASSQHALLFVSITDQYSPLLKKSQHAAFYVRRIWLGACQWRPAQRNTKTLRSCRWYGHSDHLKYTHVPACLCLPKCSYFEDEVWWRARSHCGSEDPIVVRVDQCLVQVQNQNLPLYCI